MVESRSIIIDGSQQSGTFNLNLPTPATYDVTLESFTSDKSADEKSLIWKDRTGQPFTPAWTPDQIAGLEFWLDASDVSTLTLTGSGKVDGWDSKVGSITGTSPSANRPTYDATANGGRGAVVFDQSGGNEEWLDFGDILKSDNTTGLTVMGVFKTPDAASTTTMVISKFGAPSLGLNRWRLQAASLSGSSIRTAIVYGQLINAGSNPFTHEADDFAIMSGIYDNGTASEISASVNGQVGTATSVSPDATPSSNPVYLARTVAGEYADLICCEVLAFLRPLSVFERQVVEGYLGHKWRTAQFLPAAHPYKSTPPGYIENLRDVAYAPSLGLFAAVADSGVGNRVITSPDGITWTTRASPEDNGWISITWSEQVGCFVAVAQLGTNRAMRSVDGITWTTQTIATQNWFDVKYFKELARFYAVSITGASGRVASSPDGITWTVLTTDTTTTWRGVAFSPTLGSGQGRLVVVGFNSSTDDRVMYSDDGGATWTLASITLNRFWTRVVWSPVVNRFVAVSINNDVAYSDDGINWTTVTVVLGSRGVIWVDEIEAYVAANSYAASGFLKSPDGITWTATNAIQGLDVRGLTYGQGKIVGVGEGGIITTSFTGREQKTIRLEMDELNTGDGYSDVLISDTANHNIVNIHYARSFLSGRVHYRVRDDGGFPVNRRFVLNFQIGHVEKNNN